MADKNFLRASTGYSTHYWVGPPTNTVILLDISKFLIFSVLTNTYVIQFIVLRRRQYGEEAISNVSQQQRSEIVDSKATVRVITHG